MNINKFLTEFKKEISKIKVGDKLGNFKYLGINSKESFDSPGIPIQTDEFPAFEFQKGDKSPFLY